MNQQKRQLIKESQNQNLKDALEDRDEAADYEVLSKTKGGERLIKKLSKGIISDIDILANRYSEATIQEFCALGANIASRLALLRLLTGAEKDKKLISNAIEELLEEELLD